MHHALQIPEILLDIFSHVFRQPSYRGPRTWSTNQQNSDMVALAMTCRTFKEPALDVLWSILGDMSPIARCLPIASSQVFKFERHESSRGLSQDEFDILRSYTRRIRVVMDFDMGFDWNFVPPQIPQDICCDPLFPSLRSLSCRLPHGAVSSPSHQYSPTLASITVDASGGPHLARGCLEPFSELYLNLRKITVVCLKRDVRYSDDGPRGLFTWPWKYLQALNCPEYELDIDDLRQLSCLSSLTELTFSPDDTLLIPNLGPPLNFPTLQHLAFSRTSASLESFSSLLSQMELPVLTRLNVKAMRFSSENVRQFLETAQNARVNLSIEHLSLYHEPDPFTMHSWDSEPVLTPDDLRPAMAFSNLRHLCIQVASHVALNDGGLLELATAWPQLEFLAINYELGWNKSKSAIGGITPNGLLQLLQKCPSLNYVALVIDTRGYTTSGHVLDHLPPASPRSDLQTIFRMDVLDSVIEDECISSMAKWLARVVRPYPGFSFRAWQVYSFPLCLDPVRAAHDRRWKGVYRAAHDILGRSEDDDDDRYWREGWPRGAL